DGRDFYIGFIQPSFNTVLGRTFTSFFQSYVLVSTYAATKISLSYFDNLTGEEIVAKVYSVLAGSGLQIPLDLTKMLMDDPGDIAQYRACHITSDHPINVEYFCSGADASGSYLALATPALGKRYVVASYFDNPAIGAATTIAVDTSAGVFLIIAAFDNTSVKITPNATTKGGHAGMHAGAHATGTETPYTVNLRRGQCYLVKSGSNQSDVDISGSIIESNKPIAVLGGQENATIGVSAMETEARDFMVEQMIPIDFLDTTGFVSIPLKDSQPFDPTHEGAGDNYRVYTFDPLGSKVLLSESGFGVRDMTCARLASPPPERFEVTTAVEFHSTNGKKFSVMMYDQRNQEMKPPYPAPSMMTILPISRWSKAFCWYVPNYVPTNDAIGLHQYFISLIAPSDDIDNSIMLSINGGGFKNLKQSLTSEQTFRDIPNHPELTGTRFVIHPGSYCAKGPHPFMIYNFSYQGVGMDKDTPPDADEWYSSTAAPAGGVFSSGDPGKLTTVSDGFRCTQWNLCISDDRIKEPGIRSVALLDDDEGLQSSPGKKSYNTRLDPLFDPTHFGEIELDGTATSICFNVIIDDILAPAYAAIRVTDNAGNSKIIELRYAQPKLSLLPQGANSISGAKIGADTCFSFKLINTDTASQRLGSFTLDTSSGFRVSSVTPNLPFVLRSGDSVKVKVCFSPHDTLPVSNSLALHFDCITLPIALLAKGETGLISATDQGFGKLDSGKSDVRKITIKNIGTLKFGLTKNWTLTGSKAFSVTSTPFPITLSPGASQSVDIHYSPHSVGFDTAIIHWSSDIAAPYSESVKSYSLLTGEGAAVVAAVGYAPEESVIRIRPNPANGNSIFISLPHNCDHTSIAIYDLLGREVWSKNDVESVTISEIEVPITALFNGTYYARISSNQKTVTSKFEIAR
ncbi:MAG: choice-of-anchor D domain-containing protein, partial [Ignavibacteriota bacterium]